MARPTARRYGQAAGFAALAALSLAGCTDGASPFARSTASQDAPPASSVKIVDRDVEAPEVFQITDEALWDGRPSLGGVWVASPDAIDPERVILRNPANGKFVIGALFRREAFNPGPKLQVSSDAAEALGLLAGAPAKLSVTALRREEAPATTDATKPILDANETIADAAPQQTVATASKPATSDETVVMTAAIDTTPLDAPPAGKAATVAAAPPSSLPAAKPAAPKPGPAIPVVSGQQGGTLQIGIFSVEANADRAAATLRKSGADAAVRKETTQGKTWWTVTAKSLGDRAGFLVKVKSLGFKDAYFIKG